MNATEKFIQFVKEKGFTHEDAETILTVYKRLKVIKFDKFHPTFEVKHGAYLDSDVLRKALTI